MDFPFDPLGYYKALEADIDADAETIKKQYYERAKFWHPDHNENKNALEMFQKVSVAYDILKDVKLRRWYDLLAIVYRSCDFPMLGSLKVYKNQHGKEDKALRVLKQRRVQPSIKGSKVVETKDVCNFKEAMSLVGKTSRANWLGGWWAPDAFFKNISAIQYNRRAAKAENMDNLQLLIHNAVAYEQENNVEMAWLYANQAYILAEKLQHNRALTLLTHYIKELNFRPTKIVKLPTWQVRELKWRQNIMPIIVFLILAIFVATKITTEYLPQGYFSTFEMDNGQLMAYDMIDKHVMKVSSDITSREYLYHITEDCLLYHGPDERYQPMAYGIAGQTVRIYGYMPDKTWYKVITDNGEMGFISAKMLQKGIGKPVPYGSHVYKE
ncbi:MAG: DnaJ domain-containing protein [Alphaproteobacteria bacterium]|nr:DnaJ domain-containing protein [Alphaproteobacteria bacterium]